MARVMITCPETGKPVYTHMNFDWQGFDAIPLGTKSIQCPQCGEDHHWTRQDAYLEDDGGG